MKLWKKQRIVTLNNIMEMLKLFFLYFTYWTLLVAISIFINLFWLSPDELKQKFMKLFPQSIVLTILGYLVLFIILPFSLPKSFKHLFKQIYKTYKK